MTFNFSRHLIFLITSEVEHLLTYLLDGCILSSLNLPPLPLFDILLLFLLLKTAGHQSFVSDLCLCWFWSILITS